MSAGFRWRSACRRGVGGSVAAAAVAASVVGASPALAADATVVAAEKGSLHHIAATIGAHDSYRAGFTGKGVGVALIDTGVTNVPGLKSGNVVDGPDLSFDSQDPELAHQDVYGHGTHLASIIAGRDQAGTPESYLDHNQFTGIAPDATLVDVKVGAQDGAVDVTQVIAAIDWVVEHKADHNIRVINLSYGTDSTQDPKVDPLAYAAEQAWLNGIVVVVGEDLAVRRPRVGRLAVPHLGLTRPPAPAVADGSPDPSATAHVCRRPSDVLRPTERGTGKGPESDITG